MDFVLYKKEVKYLNVKKLEVMKMLFMAKSLKKTKA